MPEPLFEYTDADGVVTDVLPLLPESQDLEAEPGSLEDTLTRLGFNEQKEFWEKSYPDSEN